MKIKIPSYSEVANDHETKRTQLINIKNSLDLCKAKEIYIYQGILFAVQDNKEFLYCLDKTLFSADKLSYINLSKGFLLLNKKKKKILFLGFTLFL